MHITSLKKKFKNQWVLAEVLKEDKLNHIIEVRPITHSKNRDEVYEALSRVKRNIHVATIYTGKIPPKGMVYAF